MPPNRPLWDLLRNLTLPYLPSCWLLAAGCLPLLDHMQYFDIAALECISCTDGCSGTDDDACNKVPDYTTVDYYGNALSCTCAPSLSLSLPPRRHTALASACHRRGAV